MNSAYQRYWEPSTGQALFASLGVATVASAITYPIEFIKTRIQVRSEGIGIRQKSHYMGYNPFKIFREIHESGRGVKGVFEGVDAFIAARLVHLFVRNLTYKIIYDQWKPVKPTNDLTHREKAVVSGIAGALGALASNPLDLISTRIQADGAIYKPNRRNYISSAQAWAALQGEGQRALLKGAFANVVRAVALNASLTGPYDYLREKMYITFGDADTFNQQTALLWASFWSSVIVLPLDTIRTRIYIQFPDPTKNRLTYNNYLECGLRIFQNEGAFSYYSGFLTFWARTHLYAFVTVYLMDVLTTRWKKQAGLKEWQM